MKKIAIFLTVLMIMVGSVQGQKYFTKTGEVSFFSSTPIEDIDAVSHSASSVYDSESGKIQWAVLIKSFEFEKALMQEHFNENYMESSKFPKAIFKGEIVNFDQLNLKSDGIYEVEVKGELTIHGKSNPIMTTATFTVKSGAITAASKLTVAVADYGIEIPAVVKDNIAKEIEISIKADYEILDRT